MKCPKCKEEKQKVLQSHPFGEETIRTRKCSYCGFSFITYEKADVEATMEPLNISIKKRIKNAKIN